MTTEEPGRRAPAPGDLRLVQEFVNTNDIEAGSDELGTPEALRGWLLARGLMGPGERVGEADLRLALRVREALRDLALANQDRAAAAAEAAGALNRAVEGVRLRLRFEPGGRARLEPEASGVDGALARLLTIVHGAMADGTWRRLKACRSDACRWLFYDHSKNRSGSWCTMAVCGNREKARAYRRRRARAGR